MTSIRHQDGYWDAVGAALTEPAAERPAPVDQQRLDQLYAAQLEAEMNAEPMRPSYTQQHMKPCDLSPTCLHVVPSPNRPEWSAMMCTGIPGDDGIARCGQRTLHPEHPVHVASAVSGEPARVCNCDDDECGGTCAGSRPLRSEL